MPALSDKALPVAVFTRPFALPAICCAGQSIYDLMRRDPSFPRSRQIGGEFSVGWLRSEVMEWLNSRPRAEFNGLDAVERRRRFHAKNGGQLGQDTG
jgi:hypothetical protein